MIKKYRKLILLPVLSFSMILQFCGCRSNDKSKDPFLYVYTLEPSKVINKEEVKNENPLYSFSADSMPFTFFMRWLSDRSGYGFVIQQGLEQRSVSAEIKNASIEEIFDSVSRSLNLKYIKIGNTFFLGDIRKEDRCIYVQRVLSVDKDFLRESAEALLSETGKCSVSNDCILVVSDVAGVLVRIAEMTNKIQDSSHGTWIIQFYITLQKKSLELDLGAKVNSSGNISYSLAKPANDSNFSFKDSETLSQNVDLMLQSKSQFIKLVSAPLMLLRDGSTSDWYDGITVPVPQYSISQYGVQTVSGYKDYKTGLSLSCFLRESYNGAIIKCKYESSSIMGYTDSIPHISKCSLNFTTEIQSGKIYLVGELFTDQDNNSFTNIFQFGKDDSFTRVQIWARAYRVGRLLSTDLKKKK